MPNDEIERAISFFLKNQAAFDSRLTELAKAQEQAERGLQRTNEALVTVVGILGELASADKRLSERMDRLAAVQTETSERLNAFIVVVEKYIASHGNGKHGPN